LNPKIFETCGGRFCLYSYDFYSVSRLSKIHFDLSPNLSPTRGEALNLTPLPYKGRGWGLGLYLISATSAKSPGHFEPQKVKVEPQKVNVEPQKVKVEPQKVKVEPQKVKVEPQKVKVEPQKVKVEPQKVNVEPQKVNVESQKVNA
jgi:hypothetical protein